MSVYFIADTHFGHSNIIRYRDQFTSIEDHDDYIMNRILSVCGKRDSLYILGDAFVGASSGYQLSEIARHVEFLHIVLGNHCNERKGSPSIHKLTQKCKTVSGFRNYKGAWLSHAPIHPDELRGKINVHGHVHANVLNDDRYICVSCEAVDYTPVNLAGTI